MYYCPHPESHAWKKTCNQANKVRYRERAVKSSSPIACSLWAEGQDGEQFVFDLKTIIAFFPLISDALIGRLGLITQVNRIERTGYLVEVNNSFCRFVCCRFLTQAI